jgi:hypothetical protein
MSSSEPRQVQTLLPALVSCSIESHSEAPPRCVQAREKVRRLSRYNWATLTCSSTG